MAIFQFTGPFEDARFLHKEQWVHTLKDIKEGEFRENFASIEHPIEMKALHVFTFASRFIRVVDLIVSKNGWHLVFVETSVLLYPILELIGCAVKTPESDKLASGLLWLNEPNKLPDLRDVAFNIKTKKAGKREVKMENIILPKEHGRPYLHELFQLRNYFIHGILRSSDSYIRREEEIIDIWLPKAIRDAILSGLVVYWHNLKDDNGTQGWVKRLARADIHPFIIPGAPGIGEAGLIEPHILKWIDDLS